MNKRYLYFTVFVSGMTTLAVELTASRLLGAYFGTSNLVWASIIGLILIYLTVGYFVGGKLADKFPNPITMYQILAWGGFFSGLVPLIAKLVLPIAAKAFDKLDIGILAGSFLGVLILFSIPITLLGMISPFAIRLAIKKSRFAGTIAGQIYAISTLGSFIGTFIPVLFLIPLIGTTYTFLCFSFLLVFVAYIGLWISSGLRSVIKLSWMIIVLMILAFFWGSRPYKTTTGQIFEVESAYNYIEVLQEDGYTMLRLNEGQGVHSMYHPTDLIYDGPWMQFLAAPFFNPDFSPEFVKSMAIIGLAGGTTARQATEVYGPIRIDGYEIDPGIIEVGKKYFGMNLPNVNALSQDGRWGLEKSVISYSIIGVDAYRPPYIPWHLTTVEFFNIVKQHLTKEGVLVVNVGRAPNDRRLIDGLVGTIGSIFPSIYVMDIPGTFNSIIYATVQSTDMSFATENFEKLKTLGNTHPLLLEALNRAITFHQPTPDSKIIFTDDLAPIEWLTNNMVLGFIFSGGAEDLK